MGADLLEPDPATGPAQDEGRHHEVIHRAQDRDEIGDQINRADHVGEQSGEGHFHPARGCAVGEECSGEPDDVGDHSKGRASECSRGSVEPNDRDEDHPGEDENPDDREHDVDEAHRRDARP